MQCTGGDHIPKTHPGECSGGGAVCTGEIDGNEESHVQGMKTQTTTLPALEPWGS